LPDVILQCTFDRNLKKYQRMVKEKSISRMINRIGIVVNYLCLIFIVLIFVLKNDHQWHYFVIPVGIISVSLFVWSYIKMYWSTGAWRFTHLPLTRLDDEETYVILEINRRSYRIFTIVVILLLLVYSMIEVPIHVTVMAALLYFAHVLSASVYQWSHE